ncbi:MAG TPA: LuxR C-terminal-related transcriptional regulator, partial [Gemmatimonadaceae bacterium]
IGARVRLRDLQVVTGLANDALLAALDELRHAAVLVESPRSQDGDYDFAHPIIQDVIYGALGAARTRTLHTAIAHALEESFARDALAHAEVLAFHYSRADTDGDVGKAALYLAAAGRDALARHADQAAVDYLGAALELRANQDPTLIEDLAQARQRLGEFDAAMALWLRARTEAESRGDLTHSAVVERQMGLACYWSGRYEEALAHYDAALATVANAGGGRALRAQVQLNRATCWHSLGRAKEAALDVNAALTTALELGDERLLARAHNTAMFLRVFIGPPDTAREHGMQSLSLAERTGDRMLAWSANYGLALLAALTGDGVGMLQYMQRSEQLADEQQSPLLRSHCDELTMQYRFASGDWDGGLALAEQTIATARALNQRNLLPRVLVWASHFYVARGEFQRAKPYLDEAWELGVARAARGRPVDLHTQVAVHSGLAIYHLAVGDYESAVKVGEQGLSVADTSGYLAWTTYRLLPAIAEAAFWAGDMRRAQRLRDRMKQDCERLGHSLGLAWVDAADGLLFRLHREYDKAAEHLDAAVRNLEAIPYVYDAARLRRWLADVLVQLDRKEDAMRELRQSHETCARLGAAPELEATRAMMKTLGMRLPVKRTSRPDVPGGTLAVLTDRERDIASLVIARKSNKEIGFALGISTRTVTTHVANIFSKMGVTSRGEFAERMKAIT